MIGARHVVLDALGRRAARLSPTITPRVGGVARLGADGLVHTAPAPTAVMIWSTETSTSAATLAGEVNTFGLTGSYHFDVWSLDSAYVISTPQRPVSGIAGAERVSVTVSGLPAGEAFVVQLTVAGHDSISVSNPATFATGPAPKVSTAPPADDRAASKTIMFKRGGGR